MSFHNTRGTRGVRPPAGPLHRLLNTFMVRKLRKGRKMSGLDTLILHTTGAKSGRPRTNPIGWFRGEDGTFLIAAAAMGAAGNPGWYFNIAAHPDQVSIEVDGRTLTVTPEQLHGPERTKAWGQIAQSASRFAGYQDQTDREIPVIRLTPRT